jgi:CDP-diacylglycerol--glycerol-3-phosphate 3-phosphatidyltransferase
MPLLAALVYGGTSAHVVAMFLGTLIGCTDFVDGYLARKYGPTVLGGLMDPVADKVFIALSFLPYMDNGWVPWWLVAALFVREFLITGLRSSFEIRRRQLGTTYLAKVKTWVQMCGIGVLLLLSLVRSPLAVSLLFGLGAVLPLVGLLLYRWKTGKPWPGAWIFASILSVLFLLHVVGGDHVIRFGLLALMLAITWVSGFDYLATAWRELLRDVTAFDAVRALGALALPTLATLVLSHTHAAAWPIMAIVTVELAHGGLDNLLAHHDACAPAWSYGSRVLGASALLALALMRPSNATFFSLLALAVSLLPTVWAFVRNRRFYLEEKLREKKRVASPATA